MGGPFATVLVGFTGAWREDKERKSLATLPPVRQITTGIGSLMGTLRDDHRGRYGVSQRGHPLVGTAQLLQL